MNIKNKQSLKVRFSKTIAWQFESNEEFVYILNNKNRKWYFIDEISKDIWLKIKNNITIKSVTDQLADEYDINYDILLEDVTNYILELQEEGLIELNEY